MDLDDVFVLVVVEVFLRRLFEELDAIDDADGVDVDNDFEVDFDFDFDFDESLQLQHFSWQRWQARHFVL